MGVLSILTTKQNSLSITFNQGVRGSNPRWLTKIKEHPHRMLFYFVYLSLECEPSPQANVRRSSYKHSLQTAESGAPVLFRAPPKAVETARERTVSAMAQ